LLFIILTVLAVINVTVVVGGKTGYVVLMVLTIYYFLDWLKWRGLFFAVLAIALFGLFTYLSPSGRMYDSIQKMYTEITQNNITEKSADEIENYSTGQRIMFYKNTMKIIAMHPVFGVGTGGYTRAYSELVKDTKMPVTDNPHNEYLMVTSQLGLVGLCSFLFLFFMQWRLAADLHSIFDKMVARGLVLTILSASMVSSTLIDHTERTLYIWMTALLFGGYISSRYQKESKNEIISNNNNEK
jgi:O-antigen ligase